MEELQAALGAAYRVHEEISGGGMSRIFRAEETALGREVAVKVLPPDLVAGVSLERFRLEILHAARLHHPNIIPVLTVGTLAFYGEAVPYYIMPFVRGESLRARLDRDGRMSPAAAVRMLRGLVDALALAHEHGIVHRDVKPGNVLLASGHALVTDFGISKALARPTVDSMWITMPGMVVGTPAYMAPEQAAGDPNADHRVDIYSTGVVAYEALTGRLPFESATPHEVVAAHLSKVPDPVARANPEVPPGVSAIVMRCLAKSPSDRYQTARELLEALEAVPLSGSQPTGSHPRAGLWPRLRVAVLAGLALVAVAATFLIARTTGGQGDTIRSLSVLPMDIVGGDSTPVLLLARGFQEELNHELQQIPGLTLTLAPHDAMIAGLSRRQIGDVLGVEHLISSSIRPFGNGYRVEVQLVRLPGDQLRWSERFDVPDARLAEIQERLARLVRDKLLATDTTAGLKHIRRSRVQAAELAYLRGKSEMNRRTRAGVTSAIAEFEQAIRLDSTHTRALTDLSSAYALAVFYGYRYDLSTYAMAARSLATAQQAIRLDPELADAYVARALIANMAYAPLDSIRADYSEAQRLRPSSPNVLTWQSSMMAREGRMAEAMALAERALQVDPLSPPRRVSVAINALGARRYDLALDQARRAEALESGLGFARALQGWSYLLLGQPDRCVALDLASYQGTRAACLAALGRHAEAARIADSLARAFKAHTLDPSYGEALAAQELAIYSAWISRPDEAAQWLRTAFSLSPIGIEPRIMRSGLFDEVLRDSSFAKEAATLRGEAWARVDHDSREVQ